MKKRILFVCSGNICRSPSAEAVFKAKVENEGLYTIFDIDSAGTGPWHAGEPADSRMKRHAKKRGYNLTSLARQFKPEKDFDRFDFIIAMDDENVEDLKVVARDEKDLAKISKMTDYSKAYNYNIVPDPYYGGDEGFELVLDLLEDASDGLLEAVSK
jgi:protein-tyrosine phosphatase